MSSQDDTNGTSGERGKEHVMTLMHPQASVVAGRKHFFPYGCTPPEYLLGGVPKDAPRADMLLLGCSDARHALFTLWTYGSECERERERWNRLGAEGRRQQQQQQHGSAVVEGGLRTLRFTLNDREPACLARVLLLLQLFINSHEAMLTACEPNALPEERDAYSTRIALCFNAYYNIYVDNATLHATQVAANQLLEISASPVSWGVSPIGSIAHIAGQKSLDRLRCIWYMYADTSIAKIKPKKFLDKERKTYHDLNVFPSKNTSPILLTGEGPGIAAPKAMEWGTEMTGIHRQYQSWGYLDPFPVLRDGARSDSKYYTKTNPAMVGTDEQELEFQVHHNCNPLSAFHQDNVWLAFKPEEEEGEGEVTKDSAGGDGNAGSNNPPLFNRPPRVSGIDLTVTKRPSDFEDKPEEAKQHIMSKLAATSLEQLSRMCWATCWAMVETAKVKVDAAVLASQGEREWCGRPPVDVRLNFVVGDAIDTCDAICLLSSEGFTAWGNPRENAEPGRVCSFMPNMSLSPFRLSVRDIGGPARFDLIDSSYLSDTLGILNVVMAASPLLKPSPHAMLRTDLRRSGPARKRLTRPGDVRAALDAQAEAERSVEGLDAKGNKKKMKKKEARMVAAAYATLTDEDWCTTQVHECAMLLGVVPVSSIVPSVGHFNTMLEVARAAKTNKKNAEIGDLGQRLRLAWKQACLIDQRSGAFVASKERTAVTLHPRVYMSELTFSSVILPFWMFMARSLYLESADCPKVLEGGQQQLRVSPYTPASFARLLSHSLRFLKLGRSHTRTVMEDLQSRFSTGLFGANVVAQLEVHLHLLSLYTIEALGATDIVRWAEDCPWWDRKAPPDGVVPPGSPSVCRVVMIASEEAVAIIRQLRDPALCILMNDDSQGEKNMISTLHYCFVRVDRSPSGSSFPPEDKERDGDPWFVLRDGLLRVKEARSDDPEAEVMVSFLVGSMTLLPAKADEIELELRLQDSASRNAAPAGVAKALQTAKGVIFRTKLSNELETAVIFPNQRAGATTLERWTPLSSSCKSLLQDDKGVEPGLGQRTVGKNNRYLVTPGRPEFIQEPDPHNSVDFVRKAGDWAYTHFPKKTFLWTLHMSNPAARVLLANDKTRVEVNVLPPCAIEIILDAAEKKEGGGKKKKRKTASEDLSRGGIDGGLRYVVVLPFPVEFVFVTGHADEGLHLGASLYEDHIYTPFVNVLQTVPAAAAAGGEKLAPRPLLSNWSFPVRSPAAHDRRLEACPAMQEFVDTLQLWLNGLEFSPNLKKLPRISVGCLCFLMAAKALDGVETRVSGGNGGGGSARPHDKPSRIWSVMRMIGDIGDGIAPSHETDAGDLHIMMHVEDILVDESNECLSLDVTMMEGKRDDFVGEDWVFSTEVFSTVGDPSDPSVHNLEGLLPMVVERGRRTYSHKPDCRYLSSDSSGGWGRSGSSGSGSGSGGGSGGGDQVEVGLMPLCLCGAGKDIPPALERELRDSGNAELLPKMYRAVLPVPVPVDDVAGFRYKSPAVVERGLGAGAFMHLTDPVGQSSGVRLAYNGPIREAGSIVESVPVAAVQERGGGIAVVEQSGPGSLSPSTVSGSGAREGTKNNIKNGDSNNNGKTSPGAEDALAGVDEKTRSTLRKAGLTKMPVSSADWAKFERAQKDKPLDPPCPACNTPKPSLRCSKCKSVRYCSKVCQRNDWPVHQSDCYADK